MKLNLETLADLPNYVQRPSYDRAGLSAGIIHIGLGNFHRAHQAWYLHSLMNLGLAHDWAILGAGVGAGVRKGDDALREALNRGIAAILEDGTYEEITARYFATSIYGN